MNVAHTTENILRGVEYRPQNNLTMDYLKESWVYQLRFLTHEKTPQTASIPGHLQISRAVFHPASVNEKLEQRMEDTHTH